MLDILAITGPIYLVVAAGYLSTRLGLFERSEMRVFGKYVINIALPALLFNALSQRSLAEVVNPVFIAAYALGSLIAMGVGVFWARKVAGKRLSAAASAFWTAFCAASRAAATASLAATSAAVVAFSMPENRASNRSSRPLSRDSTYWR